MYEQRAEYMFYYLSLSSPAFLNIVRLTRWALEMSSTFHHKKKREREKMMMKKKKRLLSRLNKVEINGKYTSSLALFWYTFLCKAVSVGVCYARWLGRRFFFLLLLEMLVHETLHEQKQPSSQSVWKLQKEAMMKKRRRRKCHKNAEAEGRRGSSSSILPE